MPEAKTSPKHLVALAVAVAALGLGALYFHSSREAVPGLPEAAKTDAGNTGVVSYDIFLTNLRRSGDDCQATYPLGRVTKNYDVPMTAVLELLDGPTEAELLEGYDDLITPGARLNSLKIVDGVARVDFDATFNAVAGSCRVGGIRAAVESTLKQFPGVESVVISINGDPDVALQP